MWNIYMFLKRSRGAPLGNVLNWGPLRLLLVDSGATKACICSWGVVAYWNKFGQKSRGGISIIPPPSPNETPSSVHVQTNVSVHIRYLRSLIIALPGYQISLTSCTKWQNGKHLIKIILQECPFSKIRSNILTWCHTWKLKVV